ncbi:MAG: DUF503 domain-containing protein [Polyangiaceae bacterium]
MFVGSLRLVIHIPEARSLKERRRVVNKLKDRIRARLSVSVCELGEADRHQIAVVGVATVARDATSCRRVLDQVKAMAETLGDAWLTESSGEVTAFGAAGQGLRGGIEAFASGGIFEEDGIPEGAQESSQSNSPAMDPLKRDDPVDSRGQPRLPRIRKK